jgi:hypothetical protein
MGNLRPRVGAQLKQYARVVRFADPVQLNWKNPATMGCRPSVDRNTIPFKSDIATVVLKNNSTPGKGKG